MAHQLVSQKTGFCFNSTAETKQLAFCYAENHDGLPTLILLDALLAGARRPVELVDKVDNTQVILAVHTDYSKNVKFLERTHTCSIGFVHERIESGLLCVEYSSKAHAQRRWFYQMSDFFKIHRSPEDDVNGFNRFSRSFMETLNDALLPAAQAPRQPLLT